jgi:hypothetical protein
MPETDTERNRENRLRRAVERISKANGEEYALRKSRVRNPLAVVLGVLAVLATAKAPGAADPTSGELNGNTLLEACELASRGSAALARFETSQADAFSEVYLVVRHAAFWDDSAGFNERLRAFCESL